jgi:hypothetical protein
MAKSQMFGWVEASSLLPQGVANLKSLLGIMLLLEWAQWLSIQPRITHFSTETRPVKQGGFVGAECVSIFLVRITQVAKIVGLITLRGMTESLA